MEKLRSDVISGIRACLISTKGSLQLRQLDNDYRTFFGERIPYHKLGFKKLEDFVQSEPSLVLTKNNNGELFVDAKVCEKSAHITDMVQKQKTDKRKLLRKAVRFSPAMYSAKAIQWRPKDTYHRGKNIHTSSRPAAVSHNQFVHRPSYAKPSVPSKIVIPDSSSYIKSHLQRQISQPKKPDISTRLQINGAAPVLHERNIMNNGRTVVIQNKNSVNESKTAEESCSSLASTKRRITQKMSEISLERDSGNSSPTSEMAVTVTKPKATQQKFPRSTNVNIRSLWIRDSGKKLPVLDLDPDGASILTGPRPRATTKITEFVRTDDVIGDLKKFVDMHKIGQLEVDSRLVKTKQNRLFTCKIKIEKHIYTSYPEEFNDPLSAEKYCAESALKDLIVKYGRRKSLLLASTKDILERIPPMLEKHNHGIWGWQLQLDYADKYNEQLPVDWLKIIDSSPCIQVEKCMENYVLRHCKPGDKGQKWNTFMTLMDVSVPSNTVQFREDGKLYAQVTCVMSANEIWCRQCSTEESDIYTEMIGRMETYYNLNENDLKAEKITEAGYYITKYDGTWYRIRAVAVFDSEVHCFFIDYGDEMAIPKSNIYYLKREFALSQAQAFVCRLVGLEELYEASANSEMLQTILYKQVILEMATDVIVEENTSDLSIPVFMNDFETGNSINQEMIPLLTIESASPVIQKETITEVFPTNIESNGDVYVQLHSHGYDSLIDLLNNLESQIMTNPPTNVIAPVTKKNSEGKIYFAKYKVDNHWYRIQIIDWSPNQDLAQIYFVDYGNTDVINVKEDVLYPLDKLSDVLSQYPFQAVKVRMAIDEIPENFVQLASKEMPEDQPVLLKIVDYDNERVPWVECFKRNADGGLFCINKSITMEAEMKRGDGSNNPKSAMRKLAQFDGAAKNVPSGGTLQRPTLPNKGEYFEVHVPFAVNPYNFFVQPLASRSKLHKMMERLQERYKDVLYSPLHVDQIEPGNIYASKHEDGYWYRTSVIKVIHSGSISVFYCDFGYYANLKVNQLLPIDNEFRELPYQALKAKLSDIKPKQSKWTMEDCENFKALVEKKHFYSILIDIEKDELYESDIVLKLILIDTSSDQDIYIGKELIKDGIAVQV